MAKRGEKINFPVASSNQGVKTAARPVCPETGVLCKVYPCTNELWQLSPSNKLPAKFVRRILYKKEQGAGLWVKVLTATTASKSTTCLHKGFVKHSLSEWNPFLSDMTPAIDEYHVFNPLIFRLHTPYLKLLSQKTEKNNLSSQPLYLHVLDLDFSFFDGQQ